MTHQTSVGAVIPAYNEAKRIGIVLEVLRHVHTISEVVIVDDGSTDKTAEVVKQAAEKDPRIRLVSHSKNQGKGQALYTGKLSLKSPVVLMVDADLINLHPEHVEALIQPVLRGETKMTMGVFRGGRWNTDLAHTLTPWLTGQRCFHANLMNHVQPGAASGYGIETALTVAAYRLGWRSSYIPWNGVTHPPSEIHRGLVRGISTRVTMYAHVIRALILTLGLKQAVKFVKTWKLTM